MWALLVSDANGERPRSQHRFARYPAACPRHLARHRAWRLCGGIVLHQILQWHHMLTSEGSYPDTTIGGLEDNTLADGLFHAFTWVIVVFGLWILWRRTSDWRWAASGRALVGWMLVGWGAFNLGEGVIDHQMFGLHHVREGAGHQIAYDLGFLALGALLIMVGLLLARSARASY
jgi:uncharacterized membrane protein